MALPNDDIARPDSVAEPSPAGAGTADLQIGAAAAAAARDAGTRDERLSADFIAASVRHVVAAWARAVAGDESALTSVARPEAMQMLLRPGRNSERVADRGLQVTRIDIWQLLVDATPPMLKISFHLTGERYHEPGDGAGQEVPKARAALPSPEAGGDPDHAAQSEAQSIEMPFIAIWRLTLDGTAPWPWRLTAGHIRTLDDFLGYQFVSRRETAAEYRERTGAMTVAEGVGPARHFLLRADFAEHDERLGASAEILVERDIAPTREEAVELVLPAVWEKTRSLLGDGDWNPSLSWLEVRELLGWRQPASGAKADEE